MRPPLEQPAFLLEGRCGSIRYPAGCQTRFLMLKLGRMPPFGVVPVLSFSA
jgi:hypothetical protein